MKLFRTACAALALALGPAVPAPAAPTGASPERAEIVRRAEAFLTQPQEYRLTRSGSTHMSAPRPGENFLGGRDLNRFNGYSGSPWCGYFAARTWGYRDTPGRYASSHAWWKASREFHSFDSSVLPARGDVLVWHNGLTGGAAQGHVAVVTEVTDRSVEVVEGNAQSSGDRGSDSIVRRSRTWTATGMKLGDGSRAFRGFAARF